MRAIDIEKLKEFLASKVVMMTDYDDGIVASRIDEYIDEFVESQQPEPHWIPVTERLPEYGTAVVTCNRDEEFEINHIIDEEDGEWFLNGAIAWMPLPEPYKG